MLRLITKKWLGMVLVLALSSGVSGVANAGFIDFEGFNEGDTPGTVNTGDNLVTFATGTGGGLIIASGGPTGGFVPDDTTVGGAFGERFLSDETSVGGGLEGAGDYFVDFATAVTAVAMQAADYRRDGGGQIGDVVTFAAYADLARTILLGTDTYTIDGTEADGNVLTFFLGGVGDIRALSLTSSGRDVGTGIDNLRFRTAVPEPSAVSLLLLGALGLALARRRQR